jgi:L-asparaginase
VNEQGRPTIVVLGLGGTIAMSSSEHGGVTPNLSAQQLVTAVPGLADAALTTRVVDFRRLPGASLDFTTLAEVSSAAAEALDRGAAGVVVTQGTDTIEETSYLLDLYHHHEPHAHARGRETGAW